MQKAITDFIHYLETVRRVSPHTVDAYRRDLAILAKEFADTPPTDITALDLQRLVSARRKAKPTSITRQLSAWRSFFDYLSSSGDMKGNPVHGIAPPKKDAPLPKALSPDEMNKLLDTKGGDTDALTLRDIAIMELLYSSGLRLSELTQLNVNDIDLTNHCVYVQRGKGGDGRTAPLGKTAHTALTAWLRERKTLLKEGAVQPALFIGRGGQRLTGRAVQQRIDLHIKKSGFGKPVSPHVFRHSCASHFLQSSGDLRSTQELLGHKNIAATQIYTRLDFQHLAKVYDNAHPRRKK